MADKLPHSRTVTPVDARDTADKAYADASSDPDAIHDNAAGEINAITLKDTPVAADVMVIEDSAASFAKKKITLTDLLGATGPASELDTQSGTVTVSGSVAPTVGQALIATSSTVATWQDVVGATGPASALTTQSGTVTISGSAAPTVGQALIATSASIAEWTTVPSVISSTVLGSNSDTISVTGLDGDLHLEYEVVARIKMNTTSAHTIRWEPNGITTDMLTKYSYESAAPTGSTDGKLGVIGSVSTVVEMNFRGRFFVERDTAKRSFELTGGLFFNGNALNSMHVYGVLINDTDNITSLDITNSVASGFLSGSWVEVRSVAT